MLNNSIRSAEASHGRLIPMPKGTGDETLDVTSTDSILEAFAPSAESAANKLPPLLTPAQVADHLGVGQKTLERWRSTGYGPRYVKLSKSTVRYVPADVADFVVERLKRNTFQ